MGINAVSFSMAPNVQFNYENNKLPQWLLEKLIALGVDPNQVNNTAEAMQLLRQVAKSHNESSSYSSSNSFSNNSSSIDTSYSVSSSSANKVQTSQEPTSARERLEKLADKLGVFYTNNTDSEDIVADIQKSLESLFVSAAADANPSLYAKLEGYQKELDKITLDLDEVKKQNKKVVPYLDMLAVYNKAAISMNDDNKA